MGLLAIASGSLVVGVTALVLHRRRWRLRRNNALLRSLMHLPAGATGAYANLDPEDPDDVVAMTCLRCAARHGAHCYKCGEGDKLAAALAGPFFPPLDGPNRHAEAPPFQMLHCRRTFFLISLSQALRDTRATQVVMLGAGMDSSAYSEPSLKGASVFEVDKPKIIDLKQKLLLGLMEAGKLSPSSLKAARVERVAADLSIAHEWCRRLQGAGFDPKQPTVWMLEGLIYYLQPSAARQLLKTIAEWTGQGSTLIMDCVSKEIVKSHSKITTWGARFVYGLNSSEVVDTMTELGFRGKCSVSGVTWQWKDDPKDHYGDKSDPRVAKMIPPTEDAYTRDLGAWIVART